MQSTVNVDMAVGIPGEMASCRPRYCYAVVADAAEGVVGVTLGKAAATNASGKYGEMDDATYTNFKGIFVSPHQQVQMKLADGKASLVVPKGCEVGVLERGEVYIVATGTAKAGAKLYVDANGVLTPTAADATEIGVFLKDCVENDIVPVRIG
jgi:hypothetical protein